MIDFEIWLYPGSSWALGSVSLSCIRAKSWTWLVVSFKVAPICVAWTLESTLILISNHRWHKASWPGIFLQRRALWCLSEHWLREYLAYLILGWTKHWKTLLCAWADVNVWLLHWLVWRPKNFFGSLKSRTKYILISWILGWQRWSCHRWVGWLSKTEVLWHPELVHCWCSGSNEKLFGCNCLIRQLASIFCHPVVNWSLGTYSCMFSKVIRYQNALILNIWLLFLSAYRGQSVCFCFVVAHNGWHGTKLPCLLLLENQGIFRALSDIRFWLIS